MFSSLNPRFEIAYTHEKSLSLTAKFISWTESQQQNRLLWLGVALVGHGCVLMPFTLFAVMMTGMNFAFFMTAFVGMAMSLVVNLAALPTKITIPVFLLSILFDISILTIALLIILKH